MAFHYQHNTNFDHGHLMKITASRFLYEHKQDDGWTRRERLVLLTAMGRHHKTEKVTFSSEKYARDPNHRGKIHGSWALNALDELVVNFNSQGIDNQEACVTKTFYRFMIGGYQVWINDVPSNCTMKYMGSTISIIEAPPHCPRILYYDWAFMLHNRLYHPIMKVVDYTYPGRFSDEDLQLLANIISWYFSDSEAEQFMGPDWFMID